MVKNGKILERSRMWKMSNAPEWNFFGMFQNEEKNHGLSIFVMYKFWIGPECDNFLTVMNI